MNRYLATYYVDGKEYVTMKIYAADFDAAQRIANDYLAKGETVKVECDKHYEAED